MPGQGTTDQRGGRPRPLLRWVQRPIVLLDWSGQIIAALTLAFLFWSGRMGCGFGGDRYEHRMSRLQAKMDRMRERMAGREGFGGGFGGWGRGPSSGNSAFDEYRQETLRRLEDEQKEFQDFLARLRMARDKAEFDQFMAERRGDRQTGDRPEPQASAG